MRRYETTYILRPTLSEDEVTAVIEATNSVLSGDNGQIIALDKWGVRTLAYLIQKETQGYYVYCDYATSPVNVSEMERKFRIDDSVMKYMTIKLSDSIDAEGVEAARGEYEAAVIAAAKAQEEAEKTEEEAAKPKAEVAEASADSKETTESAE